MSETGPFMLFVFNMYIWM